MTNDDLSLTLVEKALSVRLAIQLGDRMSARTALADVHRLVPRLRMEIQQMPDEADDDRARGLVELLDTKYLAAGELPDVADDR